jgi:hypothetical protein
LQKEFQELLKEAVQRELSETPDVIQGRITGLRAPIAQRCLCLQKAAAVPRLEISGPATLLDAPVKEDPKPTCAMAGTQVLERITQVLEALPREGGGERATGLEGVNPHSRANLLLTVLSDIDPICSKRNSRLISVESPSNPHLACGCRNGREGLVQTNRSHLWNDWAESLA